jgi:RNA polymerase sigma factor (sigma-70 family)
MSSDTTADLRDLIERLRRGDDSARRALLDRVYQRLRRIAASVFQNEFPPLHGRHELDSVVDEAWVQLMIALETTQPATVEDFYRLIFRKVRHVLLDMARRQRRSNARRQHAPPNAEGSDLALPFDIGDTTHEPSSLAVWTEIQREVESLPVDERMVFEFHYFAEFPQSEIARLMDLPPKQVSRLWLSATGRLAQWLGGFEELN